LTKLAVGGLLQLYCAGDNTVTSLRDMAMKIYEILPRLNVTLLLELGYKNSY